MSDKTAKLDEIIRLEWDMFQAVNEGGPRAACQNDKATFDIMRRAQFAAWPEDIRLSYLDDLRSAKLAGRNLVKEKYIQMMKFTMPAAYKNLQSMITPPTKAAKQLAQDICGKLVVQNAELDTLYPYLSGKGRPLYATGDRQDVTSFETYQLGELLTYSEKTLVLLNGYIEQREQAGNGSLAYDILSNTVRYYGYDTLEAAETVIKEQSASKRGESTLGCSCGADK
ncbi:MAG: DUF4125 family protein [Firmicutes bacterium]|nr:DUF4125 family protein [Bacillota bacterium]